MLQLKLCPVVKKPTKGFPSPITTLHFLLKPCKPCLCLTERQVLPWREIICFLPLGPCPADVAEGVRECMKVAAAAGPGDKTSCWGGKARESRTHKWLVCPKEEQRLV